MMKIKNKSKVQAFTFFELLIVMAIIAIMTGLGLGSMSSFLRGNDGLQASSRQLMGTINDARTKAMLEQRAWEISFDLEKQSYKLMPFGTLKEEAGLKDLLSFNANPFAFMAADTLKGDAGLKSSTEKSKKKFNLDDDIKAIEEKKLAGNIKITAIFLADTKVESNKVSLSFTPRAMNKACIIWLEDKQNKQKATINLPGMLPPSLHQGHLSASELMK